jgi:hypothetical protein
MQNNFEKQVREKMEELHLTPSDPVWNSIYRRIKAKKERRRVLFFWLPLLGLLLAGGLWWSLDSRKETKLSASTEKTLPSVQKRQSSSENVVPNKEATGEKQEQKTEETKTDLSSQEFVTTGVAGNNKNTGAVGAQAPSFIGQSTLSGKSSLKSTVRSKPITSKKEASGKINVTNAALSQNNLPGVINKNQNAAGGNEAAITTNGKVETEVTEKAAVTQPVLKNMVADSSAVAIVTKKEVKGGNKKWRKSVTLQEGYSSYHSTLFNSGTVANAFSNSLAPVQVPNRPVTQTISSGFSFAVGGELKRLIGKRLEISGGIQYHYYSAYIKVGQKENIITSAAYRADSLRVSGIYDNSNRQNFTNKFHVLEIPVSISYQLFPKIPIFLSAGASYGRLISTNALTYDHDNNFYYYNEDNYRRNYLNGFAGLQFKLINKGNLSLETGPIVQYNVTRLQRENRYTIPHLFYAGIKTSVSF